MKKSTLKKKLTYLIPITLLLIISVFSLYGASYISSSYTEVFKKQILWIIIGSIISFIIYKTNFNLIYQYSKILYILGLISLLLVLIIGRNVNGARSWFKIGPVSFQPSELFKFFFIIFMAKMVKENDESPLLLLKIIIYTFIPCILIFLEPDTGVVLMYLLLMLGFILESNVKKRYLVFLILFAALGVGGFLSLYFLKSDLFIEWFGTSFFYRMDRLLSFTENSSYQLNNALIGIGASGLFGLGLTSSKIYIPEATTDFIFDLSICNFGYLIGILIVLLYSVILLRLYKDLNESSKKENKYILSAIFYMMFFQIGEHIFMNLGLTPITGITLPFLSYGGSSLISYFMILGLILKITTNNSSYS